jgi:acyl-CoA synthetase (AMP-forming)/AMP-acid ligase II
MRGLMQDIPLLTSRLIKHAACNHSDTEIVSRRVAGSLQRLTWGALAGRARRVANMLARLGVRPGERVATLAWNRIRHLELYFGVTGSGAVLHTVNPRLFSDQVRYILNHAKSSYLCVDPDLLPIVEELAGSLPHVRGVIVLAAPEEMPEMRRVQAVCYEDLLGRETDAYEWPQFDENTASILCYTSGTTGNPKGVLYSHRSIVLHAFGVTSTDGMALSSRDAVLLATPLFHVNAWGVPFGAAMCGAKLVLPGPMLDGESLYEIIRDERCTFSLGVPTVWLAMLDYVETHVGASERAALALQRVLCGGSCPPLTMIERFDELLGVEVIHGWGMTETGPLVTISRPLAKHSSLERRSRQALRAKQGRVTFPIEMRIEDESGKSLPRDGMSVGEVKVRGPWIASGYFNSDNTVTSADGWLSTGDLGHIDPDGFLKLTDRAKDVIKSGGEWISSVELENATMGHPAVAEAAVIGVPHPKWQERPLLLARVKAGQSVNRDALLAYLADKVPRWWLPDDVIFVNQLPHTATGKLFKVELRKQYLDYLSQRAGQ